jgi:hypothetical protein
LSHHRLHTGVAAALAALAFGAPAAKGEAPRRVGVVVTLAVNMEQDEAWALSGDLGRALREAFPVDVIAGREVERRLPPDGLAEDCIGEPGCREDLRHRLEANELLLLVVVRLGDRIQIDATWVDVATGETRSRDAVSLEPGDDRDAIFAAAAPLLLPHIKERDRSEPTVIVVPTPPAGADDGRRFTLGTWIAVGVSGTALAGGTVFALSARRKYDDLDRRGCRDTPCPGQDVARVRRHAIAADLLFGTAAAAGVTALVLYLRSGGEEPPAGPEVGAGPAGSLGLTLQGSF